MVATTRINFLSFSCSFLFDLPHSLIFFLILQIYLRTSVLISSFPYFLYFYNYRQYAQKFHNKNIFSPTLPFLCLFASSILFLLVTSTLSAFFFFHILIISILFHFLLILFFFFAPYSSYLLLYSFS